MTSSLAKFDGYQLRAPEERDYQKLAEWIAADPAHSGIFDPEFFMGQAVNAAGELAEDPRINAFALEDQDRTLMYIRISRCARVHIQFPPQPENGRSIHRQRIRMANALIKGMAFLEVGLEQAGCSEWIFETESDPLRLLVQKRMGFSFSPHEMVRLIPRIETQTRGEEA